MTDILVSRLSEYSEEDAIGLGRLMPFLSQRFSGEPISKELLEAIIESPNHDQLVAKVQNRIVGAATLSIVMGVGAGKIGYLEDFVTDPEVQKAGIGSRIWEDIMAWCLEQGVNLEFTSNSHREAAHTFYLNRGATIRETTAFHVEVNHVIEHPVLGI